MSEATQATLPVESDSSSPLTEKETVWGRLMSLSKKYPNIELTKPEVSFGRASTCDVKYEDLGVSGVHCKLIAEPGSAGKSSLVWLVDNSTNGTFVDGILLGRGKRSLLQSGTVICILKKSSSKENIEYVFNDVKVEPETDDGPQDYYIRDVLGTGNFATVKLAIHKLSLIHI
eukprot:TRINITY_DN11463_c0_g2_i1.p1 TRINITY_DN11463_c0_g2~~TRINITY_DN11463_c0_g2_i1.p1  ORF type:complete len:173 (-),score=25.46 TRINITY_DN11463_c0_g2_i1:29-547(-)